MELLFYVRIDDPVSARCINGCKTTNDWIFEDYEVIEGNFEYIDSLRRGVVLFVRKLD